MDPARLFGDEAVFSGQEVQVHGGQPLQLQGCGNFSDTPVYGLDITEALPAEVHAKGSFFFGLEISEGLVVLIAAKGAADPRIPPFFAAKFTMEVP